jgi:hypothetical protein
MITFEDKDPGDLFTAADCNELKEGINTNTNNATSLSSELSNLTSLVEGVQGQVDTKSSQVSLSDLDLELDQLRAEVDGLTGGTDLSGFSTKVSLGLLDTRVETLENNTGTGFSESELETYLNGNLATAIIPDTDQAYDLGSAEKKLRHLYLSQNSLFIGDDTYGSTWFANRASSSDVEEVNTNKGSITDFNTAFNGVSTANARILSTYKKEDLPQAAMAGARTVVEDGGIDGSAVGAFFHKGIWRRDADNSVISDQVIDVYLLAGQSNAHGHADVSALDDSLKYQQGLFYTSWHHETSNASSPQYYSGWSSVAEAGFTRGDDGTHHLGGSEHFGPELGFLHQAKQIDLANGRPIGILKHAIGASQLIDDPNDPNSAIFSDWDITATGEKRGDALRAFKLAIQDGLQKLTAANYTYRIAGLIWWQGESGSSVSGLTDLIEHIRDWLDTNYTLDIAKDIFPVTITKIGYGTDLTPVAQQDAHIEIVDAGAFGHSASQNHVGRAAEGSSDTNSNGVNDMFEIGKAYADAMVYAIPGRNWTPDLVQSKIHAWHDMSDPNLITEKTGGYVQTIIDKSNNSFDLTVESSSTVTAIHNGQNNLDFLRFDSGDHTAGRLMFVTDNYMKMFLIVKPTSGNTNSSLLTWQGGAQLLLFHGAPDNVVRGRWWTSNYSTDVNDNRLNKWTLFTLEIDKTNGTITTGANGLNFAENVSIPSLNNFTGTSFSLNAYGTQAKADADWGEIIILNNPNSEESLKTEGYLAHKWGIANELDANHSYKQSAP